MSADLPSKVAGTTKAHLNAWSEITSDPHILQNVEGFRLEFDSIPVQETIPRQYKFNDELAHVIDKEIQDLLRKEVISEVQDVSQHFVSNIFLRPKPDGKYRMIIDLSELNQSVTKNHFKMDHLDVATDMLFQGAWLTSIDLKEAYYAIPLHKEDKKFISFQWNGKFFEFNCLPFGLCSAPLIFTKTLRPVFAEFHDHGFSGFGYIDDSFIIAKSYEESIEATNFLCSLFEKLGFRVHKEKSKLEPSHELVFLGYHLDSHKMSVTPTNEKVQKVQQKIADLLQPKKVKIRQVASVLGSLNDLCKASEYGLSYTKLLEIEKIRALKFAGRKQFEGKMKISQEARQDLVWWLHNLPFQQKLIKVSPPTTTIFCDASTQGWGSSYENERTGGRWSFQENELHINVLELKAVELGLKSLCYDLFDCGICIMSDNTTAVAYLHNGGGTKSKLCNDLAKSIWSWCEKKNIWFIVGHIPGTENVVADYESRHFSENTEWKLHPSIFANICEQFGEPDVDLFASRNNCQVAKYVSWSPDPHAFAVNAFHLPWSQFKLSYAFPPFRLLNRTLQKAQHERAKIIIVAPDWLAQPWLTPLQKASKRVLRFKRRSNNLLRTENIQTQHKKSIHNIPLCAFLLC